MADYNFLLEQMYILAVDYIDIVADNYNQTAEVDYYNYLFTTFKSPSSEFIEANEVVALFTKANLQKVKNI